MVMVGKRANRELDEVCEDVESISWGTDGCLYLDTVYVHFFDMQFFKRPIWLNGYTVSRPLLPSKIAYLLISTETGELWTATAGKGENSIITQRVTRSIWVYNERVFPV